MPPAVEDLAFMVDGSPANVGVHAHRLIEATIATYGGIDILVAREIRNDMPASDISDRG